MLYWNGPFVHWLNLHFSNANGQLCTLSLNPDPKGHQQAPITLTFSKASGSNILLHRVCFTKPSPRHSDSSWARAQFFVTHSKEEISWETVGRDHVSSAFRAFVVKKKRSRRLTLFFFFLLVVFCFILLRLPVFLISSFFCRRIILRTAECSGGSDLLAKTPELTSDMCGVDLTQMTTW